MGGDGGKMGLFHGNDVTSHEEVFSLWRRCGSIHVSSEPGGQLLVIIVIFTVQITQFPRYYSSIENSSFVSDIRSIALVSLLY